MSLKLISDDLLPLYLEKVKDVQQAFDRLQDAEISTATFSFYTSVASVYSSKIEGEDIELDSFIKHKGMGTAFQPDYTKKTDDLYDAYVFAQDHRLNASNLRQAHTILSRNLVAARYQGSFRSQPMYVVGEYGRIEYVAISPLDLSAEMDLFYQDLATLLERALTAEEVFFFAAYLHLVFVKIHPFVDGNGRCARLLEKWFIAQHLAHKAWFLQSEKHYYLHHQVYYQNLRKLGIEYAESDYSKALPFLSMLPRCLELGR